MGRYRTSGVYKIYLGLEIFAALLAILFFLFHRQVSRHMAEICEYKGRETATDVIADAVDEQLNKSDDDYIDILRDSDGAITSIQIDSKAVNQLQNDIKSSVNSALSEIDDKNLSVPFGTLSGITFFSGRGTDVTLKLHQVGAVDTEINSSFTSAGVNQTIHRISVVVTAEISAILPLHSTDISVSNEYLICETVIVGEVPDAFLQTGSK